MLKGDVFEKDVFGKCITMVKPVFVLPKKEKTEGCSCGHDHGHHHHDHKHHDHGHDCDCNH
jgi:hypothetical protein